MEQSKDLKGKCLKGKYSLQKLISSKVNCQVYSASVLNDSLSYQDKKVDIVAVKVINHSTFAVEDLKIIEDRIQKYSQIDSTYVVKLFEYFKDGQHIYLIMEYSVQGNAEDYLCKRNLKGIPERMLRKIYQQILFGVQEFHSKRILHCDIKLSNIFYIGDVYKLGCVGITKNFRESNRFYMAPEVLRDGTYGMESELYSFGVLFYLLIEKFPFQDSNQNNILENIESEDIQFFHVTETLKMLIKSMLKQNPNQRIKWSQLMLNDFFQNNDENESLFMNSSNLASDTELKVKSHPDNYKKIEKEIQPLNLSANSNQKPHVNNEQLNNPFPAFQQFMNPKKILVQSENNKLPVVEEFVQNIKIKAEQEELQLEQNRKIKAECEELIKKCEKIQETYTYLFCAMRGLIYLNFKYSSKKVVFFTQIGTTLIVLLQKCEFLIKDILHRLTGNEYKILKENEKNRYNQILKKIEDEEKDMVTIFLQAQQLYQQDQRTVYEVFQEYIKDLKNNIAFRKFEKAYIQELRTILIDTLLDLSSEQKVSANSHKFNEVEKAEINRLIENSCVYLILSIYAGDDKVHSKERKLKANYLNTRKKIINKLIEQVDENILIVDIEQQEQEEMINYLNQQQQNFNQGQQVRDMMNVQTKLFPLKNQFRRRFEQIN